MFKIKRKTQTRTRDGISIIEVLTSMAVATIGVFGVMVMIPFAVKQSQTGLDNDAANTLGRNVIEELKIGGTTRATRSIFAGVQVDEVLPGMVFEPVAGGGLVNYNLDRIGETVATTPPFNFPGVIHFDPIGYTADPDGTAGPLTGFTEFTIDPGGDDIRIFSANGTRLTGTDLNGNGMVDAGERLPLSIREASRLCRSPDEMFYSEGSDDIEDTAPPQPLFDFDGGNEVKRQFSGRISWSALLVPEKDPGLTTSPASRFRTHTIVYRDRFIDADLTFPPVGVNDPKRISNRDFSTETGSCYDYYQTNMSGNGFTPAVSQITFDNTDGVEIDTEELFRGDWVMLVNRIPEPTAAGVPLNTSVTPAVRAADNGYRIQIMFAKVTRVAANSVTIDGGAFDFVPSGIPMSPPPGVTQSSETYMVHLKNVVNVYERSTFVER